MSDESKGEKSQITITVKNTKGEKRSTFEDTKDEYELPKDVKPVATFDQMGLKEELLRGIYAYGFEKPSAIQQRAIVPIIKGRDVIAQSQSGTGKTTIFCVGVLQAINSKSKETQALTLSPTRELAVQSRNVMLAFGDYMAATCHACIGGKSVERTCVYCRPASKSCRARPGACTT